MAAAIATPPTRPVDAQAITAFVDALLPYVGRGRVVLRSFVEGEPKAFSIRVVGISDAADLSGLTAAAVAEAQKAADHDQPTVFCPPIATFDGSGERWRAREQDLAEGPTLSVELDARPSSGRQIIERLLGSATVVVASGGEWTDPESGEVEPKLHLHYRLAEPATGNDLATLKEARRLATMLAGGDPSNVPLVHPIRWPGSWHRKRGDRLATIVALDRDREIELGDAVERLREAASLRPVEAAVSHDTAAEADHGVEADLVRAIIEGRELHDSIARLAAKYVMRGMGGGAAVATIRGLMEGSAAPRDERWQARYDDIPRAVSTAQAKFDPVEPVALQPRSEPETPAAPASYPFKVTLFSEIAEEHVKSWLIEDMLGAGEYTCWYGAPGSRKSAIVGDAAAHVAAGLPWFGRQVLPGAVLYIAAERGGLVKRRLAAWRKHHGVCDIPLAVLEGAFALCKTDAHATAIIRFATEAAERLGQPVVWLIIDTKAQVLNGANPNADEDIADFNGRVAAIMAATGAHVTVVDHTPHTEPNRMKGSGALAGAVDGSFLVRKEGNESVVTIGSKPPNDGPDELSLTFGMSPVQLGVSADGKPTFAPVIVPVAADQHPDRPAASGGKALPPAAQKVLTALGRLFDDERDVDAPDVPGVKPGTRAVAVHELRAKAFDIGLCAAEEPDPAAGEDARGKFRDARKKAWKRAVERLEGQGLLRVEAGFAWRPGGNLEGIL